MESLSHVQVSLGNHARGELLLGEYGGNVSWSWSWSWTEKSGGTVMR